jgi:hypothetical protein
MGAARQSRKERRADFRLVQSYQPMPRMLFALLAPLAAAGLYAQSWKPLFNGKSLDGWETVGDGVWTVMRNQVILGDRIPGKSLHQSWLYSKEEFGEFDLQVEYWTRYGGNSGVSIRDSTRGKYAVGTTHDGARTPSHNGYEIQIMNLPGPVKYPTGSVYLFQEAANVRQNTGDWNLLEIESRNEMIRVKLNGERVCEHPGDPKRPKTGPIGLQLHDEHSVVMFRNIRIREMKKR